MIFANFAEAVAEGRGKAQAASLRRTKTDAAAKLYDRNGAAWSLVPATRLKPGDVVLVEAGDLIPSDGEVIAGVASVNEAAITGESAPVIRESGGDRSAVTGGTQVISDHIKVKITAAQGRHLHRPHDRAGRRRRAPEDAQRDRAQHPARRHDADLRLRRRHHPQLRGLCRRLDQRSRPGGAVRDPDPDHDRRAALGDRHRRHGSPDPLQRPRDVGPRRRGRRRRRHAAARQDRHDHARQPPGHRIPRPARRRRARSRRRGATRLAVGRDARRPLHRRARQGEIRHPRPRDVGAGGPFHSLHGADPHQRHRRRRLFDPQGRGRRGAGLCPGAERHPGVRRQGRRGWRPRSRPSARKPPSN
ncbi:MAG: hypothetical protein WDN08_07325 [Rhizomicrobium sp.]